MAANHDSVRLLTHVELSFLHISQVKMSYQAVSRGDGQFLYVLAFFFFTNFNTRNARGLWQSKANTPSTEARKRTVKANRVLT